MSIQYKFNDDQWSEDQWKALLSDLIVKGLLTWKDVTTLTLGQMNPSQVGTSLASSEGFKRRYGKGQVMSKVMEWFYEQDGRCRDCGSRLELQADHNQSKETYKDRFEADFIENMVLRCRRCNVIKRPSHEFGGQTHLTAETALMWILFSFRPRSLPDFVRMCRLYGMTMADVRMQEGWAMAHWLRKIKAEPYVLDTDDNMCDLLQWPDGGITRCWKEDNIPDKNLTTTLSSNALPNQDLMVLCYLPPKNGSTVRVQVLRQRIGSFPFSHYFPQNGGEYLAITYTPPKRRKNNVSSEKPIQPQKENAAEEQETLELMAEESEVAQTQEIATLSEGAKINLMPPRGMTLIATAIVDGETDVSVNWIHHGRKKTLAIPANSRGKRICEAAEADIGSLDLTIIV